VIKDSSGRVVELRCSHDPDSWHGLRGSGRSVKGTIHWVSREHAVPCEVRLYDRLFSVADPDAAAAAEGKESQFTDFLNPDSLEVKKEALIEPSVLTDPADIRYQFERLGYFWRDPVLDDPARPVFNRIVTLRDTWAQRASRAAGGPSQTYKGERPARRAAAEPTADVREPLSPEARARADKIEAQFGVTQINAEILGKDPALAQFFRATVSAYPSPEQAASSAVPIANWVINDLPRVQGDRTRTQLPFGPVQLARLVHLVVGSTISRRAGGEVLEVLAREGGDPREIVDRMDLSQVSGEEILTPLISELLKVHVGKADEFRAGKHGLLSFFIGQLMARTGGKADPEVAARILQEQLAANPPAEPDQSVEKA
jgi:glutaminyl-tRNA synthetase